LADSAAGFAHAVIALLADDKRRNDLSGQARRAAEGYDWENIGLQLRGAVRELGRLEHEDSIA